MFDQNKALHSLFSEYSRMLHERGLIESEMTAQIIKAVGKIMEAFNTVRNNRSLAHDNPALNTEEAVLIFNHVCSLVRFIKALEARDDAKEQTVVIRHQSDHIPF